MISYKSVVLLCDDVPAIREFYQKLFGLEIQIDIGAMVSFTCGLSLWDAPFAGELMYSGKHPEKTERPDYEVYFETDDIEGFVTDAKAFNLKLLHTIKTAPWHQQVIRFFDPAGHLVEVGESMETVVRRFAKNGLSPEEISQKTEMPIEFVNYALST